MKKSYNFTIQEIKELCIRSFIRGNYFDQRTSNNDGEPISFNDWLDIEITKVLSEKEDVDEVDLETELNRVLNGEPKKKKFFDFFKWFR